MEFYYFSNISCSVLPTFQFPTGWNSTKKRKDTKIFYREFQFPTGWNSTYLRLCARGLLRRFNSQRDGILPLSFRLSMLQKSVSIPNGMEFYEKNGRNHRRSPHVSIPNGMEFYKQGFKDVGDAICFNSQRDGILPYRVASPLPRCSFNSQRDGILPKNL